MRVLVVENDAGQAELLTKDLRRHGYDVEVTVSGKDALKRHSDVDVVLLDLDLSDVDGLSVCRGIRAVSDTPIIAVTASNAELDRVLGLQSGSDDVVVKPCGLRELVARIEAVMRRARPRAAAMEVIARGKLRINPVSREVVVDQRPVSVTRKEFDLLYLLASKPEAVVSRKQIMSAVWENEWTQSSRTVDTHVSSLRGKLGSGEWIVTVRGVGFRLGLGA